MRRFIGLSLTVALGLTSLGAIPAAAAGENSRAGSQVGVAGVEFVTFLAADDVPTFQVTVEPGADGSYRNGRLTVETQDGFCCEDFWGVRIIKFNGQVMDEAVGDGSGVGNGSPQDDDWSGAASVPSIPTKTATVEVFYDHGSDVFPAGMWVRFHFTGENLQVTQLP
jgi:hypothetical protein